MRKKIPILERLLNRTKVPTLSNGSQDFNKCWLWQGPTNNAGYGMMHVNTELHMATTHRVMMVEHYQNITYKDKIEVQHKCGNKLCVNPTHLQLGDIKSRFELQHKYMAFNMTTFTDKKRMWPTCEHCGETTYLPHFKRKHRLCKRQAKYKYIAQSISGKTR